MFHSHVQLMMAKEEVSGGSMITAGQDVYLCGAKANTVFNPVVCDVASADDDIHDTIVQDALDFAEARLQAVARHLAVDFRGPGNKKTQEPIDAIMELQKGVGDLRHVVSLQAGCGAQLPDGGEDVIDTQVSRAMRRKLTKKLLRADKVLTAISSAVVMRACCKGEVVW
eukprot:TRINITY_DN28654_c0_g1_i1.p1 TRINITY_DN28654_c0_g1~~TRINITY_DN28654_c0_g1_i1.p1  ORF type:complete len:169 (+),score=31.68 TRINITY_DN28654_c0_g1_i1:88-594(+)